MTLTNFVTSQKRILLGGYPAKQCPRRVHNQYDPTIPPVDWEPDAALQSLFDKGNTFEDDVFAEFAEALGSDYVNLDELDGADGPERRSATVDAMERGVLVIAGGELPADFDGHRVGKPDLLIRWTQVDEDPRYVPADVKAHRVAGAAATKAITYSLLSDPTNRLRLPGFSVTASWSFGDVVQLAHYTRMLQAIGRHPGDEHLVGAIVGTNDFSESGIAGSVLIWHELDVPRFKTFSRSEGTKLRTGLERYDHEHDFRVKVAEAAARRTGAADDPEPLVRPIYQGECGRCLWWERCEPLISEDDPSYALQVGRLDIREINALRDRGIDSTAALAEIDLDDEVWVADYLTEVTQHSANTARKRLAMAQTRSRMIENDVPLVPLDGATFWKPAEDIEIDLDMECDGDGTVYLWGTRKRLGQDESTAAYRAFLDADMACDDAEAALAQALVGWLRGEIAEAVAQGQTLLIAHHSQIEIAKLNRILGAEAVEDVVEHFVDTYRWLNERFIGRAGLGLKPVATSLGFAWQDDDAGGLQSIEWLDEARGGGPDAAAALQRILIYNEDDVRATAWIRDHISGEQFTN